MHSEFRIFLDAIEAQGRHFNILHQLKKDDWQIYMDRAKWELTSLACSAVVMAYDHYVFSNGPVDFDKRGCWIHYNGDRPGLREEDVPEGGVFLFRYNISTGKLDVRPSTGFSMTDLPYVSDNHSQGTTADKTEALLALVDHWCPENLRHEDPGSKLIRAFLEALACVQAHRDAESKTVPARSVESFPVPVYTNGFQEAF